MSQILHRIQRDFPIVSRPYAAIAGTMGSTESRVVEEIASLKQMGVIRRIGAVFEPSRLGFVTTLAAARVPAEQLDAIVAAVNNIPEVTHNYQRDHAWNLWFTLAAESMEHIEKHLATLRRTFFVEILNLPVIRKYKLRVDFQPDSDPQENFTSKPASATDFQNIPVPFSEDQKRLIQQIQGDLPPESQPFLRIGESLSWTESKTLEQIQRWIEQGVIRRFGAVVRHQKMGYVVNAMLVMQVPSDQINDAGIAVSAFAPVSHCYQRISVPGWPYNLYAMIHAKTPPELDQITHSIIHKTALDSYVLLPTLREFKKTSMTYF